MHVKLLSPDNSALMEVVRFKRDGNRLVIDGNILGAMPVTCLLTPSETRSALKQLGFGNLLFVISLLFRS